MNRINGMSDGKGRVGMRRLYPPFQTHERDMHGGIRGGGDAGRRDNPVHPVILSNLYSRQDQQGELEGGRLRTGWHTPSSPAIPNARTGNKRGNGEAVATQKRGINAEPTGLSATISAA